MEIRMEPGRGPVFPEPLQSPQDLQKLKPTVEAAEDMGTSNVLSCLFLLCLGYTLCSAGVPGTEFITAFMQNHDKSTGDPKLRLFITALSDATKVTIKVNKFNIRKDINLKNLQEVTVDLPSSIQISGSEVSTHSVIVTSNNPISVTSQNFKEQSSDTASLYPTSELGNEYYIFTPPESSFKEFAVIAKEPTKVTIYPTGSLTYQGKTYDKNSKLSIDINPYDVVQFQSEDDLSGSKVVATKNVVVLSGHTCSSKLNKCNHVYEQLQPVFIWGSTFYIPPVSFQAQYDLVYVMAGTPNTNITYQAGSEINNLNMDPGDVTSIKLDPGAPLFISSTEGIQVMYYGTGGHSGDIDFDTNLMTVQDVLNFCTSFKATTPSTFSNRAVLVAKTSDVESLTVDKASLNKVKWQAIPGTEYSYGEYALSNSKSYIFESSKSSFSLSILGISDLNSYGETAVCLAGSARPSCSQLKCRKKEVCHIHRGKATCEGNSEATCWAWGDPHYHTFDGKNYDFQGTCSYTMSKTCSNDTDLPSFNIETLNENRGSSLVSYLKLVNIQVYGFNITAVRSEIGILRINNQIAQLPVNLVNGQVVITQSGTSLILVTDFNLKVIYDWNILLKISIPGKYYENVCGLCGNYNSNPKDDLFNNGKELKPIDYGKLWKVNSTSDTGCWDDCNGPCKSCSGQESLKYGNEQNCGILTKKDGPFRACFDAIDPKIYKDNCVYDLCLNDGYNQVLCQTLKAYSDACARAGIQVKDWREATDCPMQCPGNSTYNQCGSSCPPTCQDPQAPSSCSDPCIETCECDPGFVMIEGKCQPTENCGCFYKGRSLRQGATFWDDLSCKKKCLCDAETREVKCSSTKCNKGEKCFVKDGIQDCYPTKYSTCTGSGDPHYVTFDNFHYDFQGACDYQLAALCTPKAGLADFQVVIRNDHQGSLLVSYTTAVTFKIFENEIQIRREFPAVVLVNGIKSNLPLSMKLKPGNIDIYQSGRQCIVQTSIGIRVTFDWEARVAVVLPSTYSGYVCGLCGNFNDNPNDDLTDRSGTLQPDIPLFGHSYREGERAAQCPIVKGGNCKNLASLEGQQKKKLQECGMLLDTKGPFRDCASTVDPITYFKDCVYDMCAYGKRQDLICRLLTGYTESCQAAGAVVYNWRTDIVCPIPCPLNSMYNISTSPCPSTCLSVSMASKCDAVAHEGCECNPGYVLSGSECVPLSQCGCLYNGQYYKPGDIIYPDNNCEKKCTCNGGGSIYCESTSCGPYEVCSVVKGIQSCNPNGSAVCSTIGKTSYNTFDNFGYDFSGNCSYVLSQTCLSEGSKLNPYFIQITNIESSVSLTKKIILAVYLYNITIYQGPENIILVNDIVRTLPFELGAGQLRAEYQGGGLVIKTDFGLILTSDNAIHVTVPATYHNQLCGLCGNYNDNDKDEFSPHVDDVVSFAESWKDSADTCVTIQVCDAKNKSCSDCPKKKQKQLAGASLCGILVQEDGPFAPCHKIYDPTAYLKSCVNILCAKTGELCPILQGYVKICQDAGAIMKPWRSSSFCPYTCTEDHSHYEFCADVCYTSCSSLYDITSCPTTCSEGCQCNNGYFFQNGRCVTPAVCDSCTLNGAFYQVNQTIISEDCSQSCTCNSHRVMECTPHGCSSDEICKVLNGKIQCVNKDPCKAVSCRNKEHCESTNDVPVCVPDYTSSCIGWGDPHYLTFDGYSFDFHGTCTYVLAEYHGTDATLEYFRIEEKNDNRGNLMSSSVRLVNIFVSGFNISIVKDEIGQVRVNGEITLLPVSLLNDKLTIIQSGVYATLKTNFGLKVAYDYNWQVEITLPSSYYGSMGGLCGNFNNNPRDDKISPDAKQLTTITKWAKSWKVVEDDTFCSDSCQGNCLECNETLKTIYEGEGFCGVIEADDGPFSSCHANVSTTLYFTSCVKDVCSHNGVGLCQAFESYAAACRKQGIELPNWRKATGCNMICPENSQYQYCGGACPANCFDRNAPDRCTDPCIETCQCNEGYIMSAGSCIDVKTCGCLHNEIYYQANQEFWSDEKCKVYCKCDSNLGMVICEDATCQSTERCMLRNGVRGCYPVSYSTCTSSGDPHYTTFDGKHFNFMGTCMYQLTELCVPDPNLTPFNVKIQNDKRGSKNVSYTKSLTLEVYNYTITLTRDYPDQVLVDGVAHFIPFSMESNIIKVFMKGEHAFVRTDFEVSINYNWDNYGRVLVPNTYANALCGLCGNFNQDPLDDLSPDDQESDGIEFENRYKVGDVPECKVGCVGECPKCSDKETEQYSGQNYCGVLTMEDGPLSQCKETLDPTSYFTDCVFDSCQYEGRHSAVCAAIARYVIECQEKGVQIKEWRKGTVCEPTCPPNSHYELCGPGCHTTCSSLISATDCVKSCTEGCYCDNGFVLSGGTCVPMSDCGCDYKNSYYQKGQVFYPAQKCNERCECGENGEVQCEALPCGPNEECRVVDGAIGCHSKIIGTCLAGSNNHFISFDGLSYSLQNSCSYVLTDVCSTNVELRNFSVIAESIAFGEGPYLGMKALKVVVDHYEIIMMRGVQWTVMVNEELHNLPLVLDDGEIHINQEGSNIVIHTSFELVVVYDLANSVQITVPGEYQEAVCGLCGNFNRQPEDDFRLPSGQLSTNAEEFGAAWNADGKVKDCGCKNNCPSCDDMRAAIFSRDEACGLLQKGDGPFAECHGLVNVTGYFSQCLLDMCASDGQAQILCDSIQAYATACLAAGAKIQSWRTSAFCAPDCPENSHYELCTHTCDVTCSGISAPGSCSTKCSAGCQCDEGYLFDRGLCVSMDKCGCFYNGRSYNLGDTIVSSDCLQQCTCQSGGAVECKALACSDTQFCGLREGIRECIDKRGTCTLGAHGSFSSFDLLANTIAAGNTFDLTSVCDLEDNSWFRLVVITQSVNNDANSQISSVHVYFTDFSLAVTDNRGVWKNGRPVKLPYTSDKVTVNHVEGGVALTSGEDFDFTLTETGGLTITVNEKFLGGLCGVCGNFNRDNADDSRDPKGKYISSFNEFIESWQSADFVRGGP